MESCKNCKWYNQQFDIDQAKLDDILKDDSREYHYCPMFMYPEHIKPEVFDNKENCSKYFKAP